MNGELCPHGRVVGHVCLDCSTGTAEYNPCYIGPMEITYHPPEWSKPEHDNLGVREINLDEEVVTYERKPSGLDAAYYDLPENIHSAQDLIEFLGLNFANGNILKSLIRQHGSQTKATDELYETEKRFYFAKRELERVRRGNDLERQGERARRELEELMRSDAASQSVGPNGGEGGDQ